MMWFRLLLLSLCFSIALAGADDYVLVRGGSMPGRPGVLVDDFDMQLRPVTNAEYQSFVRATAQVPPLHWEEGKIPAGWESHPVIFVNRFDAAAYARWLTEKEGRIHRLPTRTEFEYAARGGDADAKYPWGGKLPEAVNWDASGERTFAQWRQHLQPAGLTPPNALGLRDMAGNVWQMVDTYPDLAVSRWIYRVNDVNEREGDLAGGSWARAEYYLRCGVFGRASAGIRHPDIGFRLVREPASTTHFRQEVRRVIALPQAGGAVY
ncbi:MAG: formylglycine-generating enzyme family protein, partial [bacterium]|nr:formylglycine-generating enzyme family protein [bacterium]